MGWRDRAQPAETMGWRSRATPAPVESAAAPSDSLEEPGGLSHGPGTSFALNALDSLSMVGLPTTLGMKDALMGDAKDGDFRTRYRKAKEFYEGGMGRLSKANPATALAGQMAPMVIPGGAIAKGARFVPTVLRGAASGALSGGLRGPSATMDGDFEGTAKDIGLGAAAGTAFSAAGSGAGKIIEKGGEAAKRGFGKVLQGVTDKVKSEVGKARNFKGQGAGAIENLANVRVMEDDAAQALVGLRARRGANAKGIPKKGVIPGLENIDPKEVDFNLGNRVGNAEKMIAKVAEKRKRLGPTLMEPRLELRDKFMRQANKAGTDHLKGVLGKTALGAAGFAAADAAGVDGKYGAAVAGLGGLYAARKITQAAVNHPKTLKKLMALKPIGQFAGRKLAAGTTVPKSIGAIVYALRDDPEVKRVLQEYEAEQKP